jgi:hypothetical protein
VLATSTVPGARAETLPPEANEIRALLRTQKLDDAVAKGEAWTQARPKDAVAWHWLGRAYVQQALKASIFSKPKWASKVQDAFEQAVALDGSNLEARFDLMQFYLQAPGFMGGGADKARARRRRSAGSTRPAAISRSARWRNRTRIRRRPEREYRAAIAAAPDEARGRRALANLLSGQKRWGEARARFRSSSRARRTTPGRCTSSARSRRCRARSWAPASRPWTVTSPEGIRGRAARVRRALASRAGAGEARTQGRRDRGAAQIRQLGPTAEAPAQGPQAPRRLREAAGTAPEPSRPAPATGVAGADPWPSTP